MPIRISARLDDWHVVWGREGRIQEVNFCRLPWPMLPSSRTKVPLVVLLLEVVDSERDKYYTFFPEYYSTPELQKLS